MPGWWGEHVYLHSRRHGAAQSLTGVVGRRREADARFTPLRSSSPSAAGSAGAGAGGAVDLWCCWGRGTDGLRVRPSRHDFRAPLL